MNLIKKIIVLLLLSSYYLPVHASVADFGLSSCKVFNDDDKKPGEEQETEEEPDCD